MYKKILFILVTSLLMATCITLTSCKKQVKISYELQNDEKVQNEYLGKIKIGDNLYTILKNTTATKLGYDFIGWSLDGENLIKEDEVINLQEIKVYPLFQKARFKITYLVDDEVYQEDTYLYQEEITLPTAPTKEDGDFTGWDPVVPTIMPACDLTVKATFGEKTWSITFIIDDENEIVQRYHYQETIVPPTDITKEGYTFTSWTPDVPDTMPKEDLVFHATFLGNEYNITYVIDGVEEKVTYRCGDQVTPHQTPVKTGYTFTGWDADEPTIMPAHDVILTAEFTVASYTITYVIGEEEHKETYQYGEEIIKIADPEKEGYTFGGWTEPIPSTMPAHNITTKAIFRINKYTITFKAEGYDDIVLTFEYQQLITLPNKPEKAGYFFKGWSPKLPSVMPAKNLEVVAIFEQNLTAEEASGSKLLFIGHAGCYSGMMNSERAFLMAVQEKGYDAIECDLAQTKDGVFVLCHDDKFGGVTISQTNWADLKDVEDTVTRGGIKYTSTLCTLDRYLEICKEYNVFPVIELKWSNGINPQSTARMPALMAEIKKHDMLHKVIFLTSQYNCLEWVRNNGYDYIPCQYLVGSADSQTVLERCIQYNFDVSFDISKVNTKEWIDRYHEAGLEVSSYTFNQYQTVATLQKFIDMGVDFVTCDVLTASDVTIPPRADDTNLPSFNVTFTDGLGHVLKETKVKQGKTAVAPVEPTRLGYYFNGWDNSFQNVQTDLVINATWEIEIYEIIYNDNLSVVEISEWSNKQAFLEEFYTDWFNWFSTKVNIIEGLTKEGNIYTLATYPSDSNGTASWEDVKGLMDLDIYVVEKTIGHFVYKPVENNSADYIPEIDDGYFLNSEPYRSKYIELNAYFLNAIEQGYSGYDHGYHSNGTRIQIFFRFHQWQKGTNIPSFDKLPKKHNVTIISDDTVILPTTPNHYTINDELELGIPTRSGYQFDGWYKDQECTERIEKITKGMTGKLVLYAKWTKI